MLSPVEFEKQQKISPEGVYETRGYSTYQRNTDLNFTRQRHLPDGYRLSSRRL